MFQNGSLFICIITMYNISLHLFPIFLQWLRVRMVLANITVTRLIWVFSYSTNAIVASKLITPVKLGNNTRPYMPKTINLSFSNTDPYYDLFLSSSISSNLHFKPIAFFSKNPSRWGILSSFDNLRITLLSFKGK